MSALLGLEAGTDSGVHIYFLAAVSEMFLPGLCTRGSCSSAASPVSLPSLSCTLRALPSEERLRREAGAPFQIAVS